jgi:hypothetical protein
MRWFYCWIWGRVVCGDWVAAGSDGEDVGRWADAHGRSRMAPSTFISCIVSSAMRPLDGRPMRSVSRGPAVGMAAACMHTCKGHGRIFGLSIEQRQLHRDPERRASLTCCPVLQAARQGLRQGPRRSRRLLHPLLLLHRSPLMSLHVHRSARKEDSAMERSGPSIAGSVGGEKGTAVP